MSAISPVILMMEITNGRVLSLRLAHLANTGQCLPLVHDLEHAFGTSWRKQVKQLRQLTLLDLHFQRREDFDLPSYWHKQLQNFGELTSEYGFTLRMHPDRMNFAKEIVPGRYQQVEPAGADGWISVHFQLESIDLAKMLVFGLGQHAVVVEPQELQEAMLCGAREVLSAYASARASTT